MSKVKLSQGEISGIRLVADALVVRGLMRDVLSQYSNHPNLPQDFESRLRMTAPKLFEAEMALQNQINEVRKVWIEYLEESLKDV
ncbi:hypothetical protein VSVS12_03238 [Vibrio scophthalmi]|uniref:hypothetical protein n=1 Tax=Vibrio scophthalmi TaxID=45658 RepID=UPI00080940D0|nr:hypothetical protein [Vibrio scophthalmi]ANS86947.1 hypothetical protein VSVS12_03238 [Vibrio scophthalmi]